MQITTKFSIGDKVVMLHENKIIEVLVTGLSVTVEGTFMCAIDNFDLTEKIEYTVNVIKMTASKTPYRSGGDMYVTDKEIFSSRDELIASL